ncbi:putative Acyl-CoA thioesterase II [Seiridium cardinale]
MPERAPVEPLIEVVPVECKQDVFTNKKEIWDASKGYQRSIYGGHLLGQSVSAAKQTVPAAFDVHSLQSAFLRPGDGKFNVYYHVERVMDGRTLASRLVRAMQGELVIFVATIGFHRHSDQPTPTGGALKYQEPMPDWALSVQPNDKSLKAHHEMLIETGFPEEVVRTVRLPFEWGHLPAESTKDPTEFRERSFLRSESLSTDDRGTHLAALAWVSDAFLIYTANLANPTKFPLGMAGVAIETSVNHSVWFHLPSAKIDAWLACERRTSWGADGRVLIYQTWWNRADGQIVLSCVQEALLRLKNAQL